MNSILNFRSNHLSEQQIDDQLIGDPTPAAAAHLAACAPCARRVAEAELPIASFRAVAMEWSERRSATMPPQSASMRNPRVALRFAFGTATAALLVAVFAMPAMRTPAHPQAASPVAVQTIAQVEPGTRATAAVHPIVGHAKQFRQPPMEHTTISRDNEMLQEIDVALSTPAASPASLGLEMVSSEKGISQHPPALLQD